MTDYVKLTKPLQAFHNNRQIQLKFFDRAQEHYNADEIIKGVYWENGKGCMVGCMVHSNNHKDLEIQYGIPEWLGRLIDILFEGMKNVHSKEFFISFVKTITKYSFLGFENWQHIYHQLCVFMLEKICKNTDNKIVVKAICDIITLHKIESKDESAWSAAESAAWSAAWSAAESAAWSAAWSAAESAAWSAAWSAAESAAWSVAESATRSTANYQISEKLIELLEAK